LPDPLQPQMHETKRFKRYLKISSVERTPSVLKQSREMRPLSRNDVERMKDEDINVKLCDMGNACYITNHYSDII
jgi:hypothetical protein